MMLIQYEAKVCLCRGGHVIKTKVAVNEVFIHGWSYQIVNWQLMLIF